MNELKFKNKKVCRVCLYPIVFYKDAYYKKGANGQSYPLNIHYVDCANKVFVEGLNAWEVSSRELSKVQQMRLVFR